MEDREFDVARNQAIAALDQSYATGVAWYATLSGEERKWLLEMMTSDADTLRQLDDDRLETIASLATITFGELGVRCRTREDDEPPVDQ